MAYIIDALATQKPKPPGRSATLPVSTYQLKSGAFTDPDLNRYVVTGKLPRKPAGVPYKRKLTYQKANMALLRAKATLAANESGGSCACILEFIHDEISRREKTAHEFAEAMRNRRALVNSQGRKYSMESFECEMLEVWNEIKGHNCHVDLHCVKRMPCTCQ